MVTVTGFTKDNLVALDNQSIVDSELVGDQINLIRRDGSKSVVTGSNKGPEGSGGIPPIKYSARSNAALSIPNVSYVDMSGYSFISGTAGLFTLTSGTTFTATQAGIYYFTFRVYYASGAANTRRIVFLYKDGTERRRIEVNSRNSNPMACGSHIMPLSVGSVIKVVTYQTSGATILLATSGHDFNAVKIA